MKKLFRIIEKTIFGVSLLSSMIGIVIALLHMMKVFIPPYGITNVHKFFDAMGYAGLSLVSAGISMLIYYDIVSGK